MLPGWLSSTSLVVPQAPRAAFDPGPPAPHRPLPAAAASAALPVPLKAPARGLRAKAPGQRGACARAAPRATLLEGPSCCVRVALSPGARRSPPPPPGRAAAPHQAVGRLIGVEPHSCPSEFPPGGASEPQPLFCPHASGLACTTALQPSFLVAHPLPAAPLGPPPPPSPLPC
ncbi:MAG: hypothetical protein J3K34DRAFT_271200 [Monoraphidium minutum]|nr:MAG: hypothetical protein J3K34DRAFT_271200 [Monoraphidium minutum]